MTTISIKLKKQIIEKIDYLVEIGRYQNRNTAIMAILEDRLASENYILESIFINKEKIRSIFQELIKLKNFQINLKSKKSATELVSEGRER